MLDAERVVFLVMVGLNLCGLCFDAAPSVASAFVAAGAPRLERVRVAVSSCIELRRCEERAGRFRDAGIGLNACRHSSAQMLHSCNGLIRGAHIHSRGGVVQIQACQGGGKPERLEDERNAAQ